MKRLIIAVGLGLLALTLFLTPLWQAQAQTQTKRLVTVLNSARRTADTNSDDQLNLSENLNTRGVYLFLNVSEIGSTPLVTLSVQAKDPVSGNYQAIFTATTGVTTTGTKTYLIYPGIGSAAGNITQVQSLPLPAYWRVYLDHDDTDPITYTVGGILVQ